MLTCEECTHFVDGKCEYDIELYECEDAYDCNKFEYNGDGM